MNMNSLYSHMNAPPTTRTKSPTQLVHQSQKAVTDPRASGTDAGEGPRPKNYRIYIRKRKEMSGAGWCCGKLRGHYGGVLNMSGMSRSPPRKGARVGSLEVTMVARRLCVSEC